MSSLHGIARVGVGQQCCMEGLAALASWPTSGSCSSPPGLGTRCGRVEATSPARTTAVLSAGTDSWCTPGRTRPSSQWAQCTASNSAAGSGLALACPRWPTAGHCCGSTPRPQPWAPWGCLCLGAWTRRSSSSQPSLGCSRPRHARALRGSCRSGRGAGSRAPRRGPAAVFAPPPARGGRPMRLAASMGSKTSASCGALT
mmetsp:Transcript_108956/g.318903  ORF Transcript_108956/g.318903 Transcript_108956/m.318903 type:complete len:200 (-) Transcript_108956:43-642(-)